MSKGWQRSFVSAGGLYLFGGGVSSAFEEDILSCNLLFQLGASVKHDKFSDGSHWQQFYLSSMSKFGHDLLRRNMESIPVTKQDCVWGLVKSELSKSVPLELIQRAETTVMHLQKHDSDASRIFKANASRCTVDDDPAPLPPVTLPQSVALTASEGRRVSSAVSMQLGFVDKEPILTQAFVSFKANYPLADQPSIHLLSQAHIEGNLELITVTAELDKDRYALIREDIQRKLGARRSELILPVEEVHS